MNRSQMLKLCFANGMAAALMALVAFYSHAPRGGGSIIVHLAETAPEWWHLWALVWLPAMIPAASLTPAFLRVLRQWKDLPGRAWWPRVLLAGIGFAFAVSIGLGMMQPVLLMLSDVRAQLAQGGLGALVTMIYGPVLFGLAFALSMPLEYGGYILSAGVLAGVMNGWVVRRQASKGSAGV
jgi:hypothetical protein